MSEKVYSYDVIIIGAGMAGMAAAISCAEKLGPDRILLLEKKEETGKKILATGNGRCNLANENAPGYQEASAFLRENGISVFTESGGRVYPRSESAADVRDLLEDRCLSLGVRIRTEVSVTGVRNSDGVFYVTISASSLSRRRELACRALIVSCGGKAGPQYGTSGDGYRWLRDMGHTVTRLAPALTAVETSEETGPISGARAKGAVTLLHRDVPVFREEGEIQFTDYGLSGICIFNLSRYLIVPEGMDRSEGMAEYQISVDFLPELDDEDDGCGRIADPGRVRELGFTGPKALRTMVRKNLAHYILKRAGGDEEKAAELVRDLRFHPADLKGWKFAQVTRGGVAVDEVDPKTQESKMVPGLFLAGEVLDYEGPCGGYNLQHAYLTGQRAGWSAADYINRR